MGTTYSLDGAVVEAVPAALALHPYGAFTTLVAVAGGAVGWHRHEERLAAATEELWGHRLDRAALRDVVRRHLGAQGAPAVSLRITAYPAEFDRAAPERAAGCRLLLASTPCDPAPTPTTGFAAATVPHRRETPHLKTNDLLGQLAARRQARLAGRDDALLVDAGQVLEGATWSVLAWLDGRALTPAAGVLPSTTVAALHEVAPSLGYRPETGPLRLADLAAADLVLAVSVHHPARALDRVDDTDLPVDHALLIAVATAYAALPREPI